VRLNLNKYICKKKCIYYYYNMSGITLYLGDEVTVLNSNFNFNNANAFVKAPTENLHVANKSYVDTADQMLRDLIISQATTSSQAYTNLLAMITQLQADNTALETQVDNLYQYFFNQPRDGPVPSRE
jgi:hypothetical protein